MRLLAVVPLLLLAAVCARAESPRPRLLVLTDIGGDPDDMQSMRRLMLYANEFEIAGLVASASGTPGELRREVTRPELIREIVRDYAAVRPNLARHAPGYPPAETLERLIHAGSSRRGIPNLGAGRGTPASGHIIAAADASPEPLHVVIWGGAHDLAQALWDVRDRRSPEAAARFVSRLRVYAIADQDAWKGEPGTGQWIRENFPGLRYVESGPPGMHRFTALFRGMYQNDSAGGDHPVLPLVPAGLMPLTQRDWVETNVREGHGPLGAGYPIVPHNPASANNTSGVKEGDTPSWFFVLPNGLSDPEYPEYGGWGGRFRHDTGGHYIDAEDEHPSGSSDASLRRKWTVARWREAYQNDFAARMDWCVAPRQDANHNPEVVVNGQKGKHILRIAAAAGQTVALSAAGSIDPDGHRLAFRWFVYREAGACEHALELAGATASQVRFVAPKVTQPRDIHVICEARDDGEPNLYAYRRIIVTVSPK
jgi:hypothetical protein